MHPCLRIWIRASGSSDKTISAAWRPLTTGGTPAQADRTAAIINAGAHLHLPSNPSSQRLNLRTDFPDGRPQSCSLAVASEQHGVKKNFPAEKSSTG
jgi:hypothetical protein